MPIAKTTGILVTMGLDMSNLKKQLRNAKTLLGSTKKHIEQLGKTMKRVAQAGVAALAYGLYKLAASGISYTNSMEGARASLEAMIKSSVGYKTTTGEMVTVAERQAIVNRMVKETFEEIQSILPETAMEMDGLTRAFALMKPAADQAGASMTDQVKVLKLVANAATNFGLGANELATGIDDLYRGTVKANQGFGKMLTSLGITNEEIKNSGDVTAYLVSKLSEAGQMADTMAVATSNLKEAWNILAGEIMKPIFDRSKAAIKELTKQLGIHGPKAAEAFSKGFTSFAKVAVTAIGYVAKAVGNVINMLKLAWNGYAKLGSIAAGVGNKIKSWAQSGVAAIADLAGNEKAAESIRKVAEASERAAKARFGQLDALGSQTNALLNNINEINGMVGSVVGAFNTYVAKEEEVAAAGVNLASTVSKGTEALKGIGKAAKKAGKSSAQAAKDSMRAWEEAIRNVQAQGEEMSRVMQESMEWWYDIGATIETGIGDALLSLTDKATSFGDVMKRVLNDIARQLMSSALSGLFGNKQGVGSGIGSMLSNLFSFNATGGVVNSPTVVGMQGNRMAVAGESGPEAIVPLVRHNGELGVSASPVTVNVQNYSGGAVSVEQNGDNYDIIVSRLTREIQKGSGNFGSTLESRYGMRKV